LLGLNYLGTAETRQYNNLNQMTNLTVGSAMNITYTFPAGANNGKISQQTNSVSEETVTYQYDSLNRLLSASSSQSWSETYGYDGFGNLLSKTPTGGAPTLSQSVNAATNQIVGVTYDANGNQLSGGYGYDAENRLATATGIQYGYDSRNKRVWSGVTSGSSVTQTVYFYGVDGQRLGIYSFVTPPSELGAPQLSDVPKSLAVYFGGKRVGTVTSGVTYSFTQDRLGSNGSYYPYGEARGTVPQDDVGYATYTNDSATGLQYADQRYYASNFGRFMSPDPYQATATSPSAPSSPESWNRYAYVVLDPVNAIDPLGQDTWFISNPLPGPPTPLNGSGGGTMPGGGNSNGSGCEYLLSRGVSVGGPCPGTQLFGVGWGKLFVSKKYHAQGPCVDNAKQVMNAVENNFSTFGNFKTAGPGGIGESVTFNPAPGPLSVGESIPITIQVGASYTQNVSVTVSSVTSGSLVFTTVPGHFLYPATITFSASDIGSGSVGFDISVSGSTSSLLNTLAFIAGGGSFEDAQWQDFLSQIGVLCHSVLSGN
jgi:RHS repeat-associated protein